MKNNSMLPSIDSEQSREEVLAAFREKISSIRSTINSFSIDELNTLLEELEKTFKHFDKRNTGYNTETLLLLKAKNELICLTHEAACRILQADKDWFRNNHAGSFALFWALKERRILFDDTAKKPEGTYETES